VAVAASSSPGASNPGNPPFRITNTRSASAAINANPSPMIIGLSLPVSCAMRAAPIPQSRIAAR